MQRTIKMAALAAVAVVAGTAGAFADEFGYGGYGYRDVGYANSYAWGAPAPGYDEGYVAVTPPPMYYHNYGPRGYGYYGNGSNHPTPSSTQGDVGPEGNDNGTTSGIYGRW
jgi:hypothetical protein